MVKFLVKDSRGNKYYDTTLTREQIFEWLTTGNVVGRDSEDRDETLVVEGVLEDVVSIPVSENLAKALYMLSKGELSKAGFDAIKNDAGIMAALLNSHEGEMVIAPHLPKKDNKVRVDSLIQLLKDSRAGDRDEIQSKIEAFACQSGLHMYLLTHPGMRGLQFSTGFLQEVILAGELQESELAEMFCQVVCKLSWVPYQIRHIKPKFNKSQEQRIYDSLSAKDAVLLTGRLGTASRSDLINFILDGSLGDDERIVAKLLKPTEKEVLSAIKSFDRYNTRDALKNALELNIVSGDAAKEIVKKRKLELDFPAFLSEEELISLIKRRKEVSTEVWKSAKSQKVWETIVDNETVDALIGRFKNIPKHTQGYAREKILAGVENSQVASVLANVTGLTANQRSELAEKAVKTISGAKLIIEKSDDPELVEKAVIRLADSAEGKRIIGQTWPEEICKRLAARVAKMRKSTWFGLHDIHEDIRRHMTSEQKVEIISGRTIYSEDSDLLTDEEIVACLNKGAELQDQDRLQKIPTKLLKTAAKKSYGVEVELLRRGEIEVTTFNQAVAILSTADSSEDALRKASEYIVANPEEVMSDRWSFDKIKGETRESVVNALLKTKDGIRFLAQELEDEEFIKVSSKINPDTVFKALGSIRYLVEMIGNTEFVNRHIDEVAENLNESVLTTFVNHSVAYHGKCFPLISKLPTSGIYEVIRGMNHEAVLSFAEFLAVTGSEDLRKACVIYHPTAFTADKVKEVLEQAIKINALEIIQAHPALLDDVLGAVLLNRNVRQALNLVDAQVDGWKMLVPVLQMSKNPNYAPVSNKEARIDFFSEVMTSVDYYTAQDLMNDETEVEEVRKLATERFKALNVEVVFRGAFNGELTTERPDLIEIFQVESVYDLHMSTHLQSVIALSRDKRRPENVPLLLKAKEGVVYATLDAEYVERELLPQTKINNMIKAKKKAVAESQIMSVADRPWSMEIMVRGTRNAIDDLAKSLKDAGSDHTVDDFKGRPKRGHIKTPVFVGDEGISVVGALGKRIQEGGFISSASMTIETPEFNKLRSSKENELIENIETYYHVVRAALGTGYRRIIPAAKGRGVTIEFNGFDGLDLGSFAKFMVNLVEQMVKSKIGEYQVEREKMLEMIDALEKDLDSSGLVEKQELLERISTSKILFAG